MKILSIDSANKNIGICYLEFDENWLSKYKSYVSFYKKQQHTAKSLINALNKLNDILDSVFKIKYVNWYDLIPGRKLKETTLLERTRSLKGLLNSWQFSPDVILVEYQMGQNDKSRTVASQILYYYSDAHVIYASGLDGKIQQIEPTSQVKLYLVGPSLKNTISFGADITYSKFLEKFSRKTSNKKHTMANFIKFTKVFNQEDLYKNLKIPKYDDIADSFMMASAWCLCEKYK